jgi:hypothetical protein
MLASQIITQAQTFAGIGVIEGNAINENAYSLSSIMLRHALNDINNDVKLSLFQESAGYPQPGRPLSDSYPFPDNCRRVLKGFDNTAEWRKTSFADVLKARKTGQGYMNIFAINNRAIYLSWVSPFQIVYAREFAELQPEDEVDIPAEAETYVICKLAHDLAMGFNTGSIDRTKAMADRAYKNLLANTASNAGAVYINPNLSYARFSDLAIY